MHWLNKNLDLHRHSQKCYSYFIEILGPWGTFAYINGDTLYGCESQYQKKNEKKKFLHLSVWNEPSVNHNIIWSKLGQVQSW